MNKVDFKKYYTSIGHVEITSENEKEAQGRCPFHDDTVSSFSFSKITGLWKCFGSCNEGGNIDKFHKSMFPGVKNVNRDILKRMGIYKTISSQIIEQYYNNIFKADNVFKWLTEERGIQSEYIEEFQLGFNGFRLAFPILDDENNVVNIKLHAIPFLKSANEVKSKSYSAGYGENRLYPIKNISGDSILLFEGELDTILAYRLGFNSMCCTAGAGSWPEKFNDLLAGKNIYICYDIDKAGKDGAIKVANALCQRSKVKIINLPITEPANGDFSDYILKHGGTKESFQKLIDDAKYHKSAIMETPVREENYKKVSLNDAAKKENYDKRIQMDVIISGKDLAPYFVPIKMKLLCSMGKPMCKKCSIAHAGGCLEIELNRESKDLLRLIDCTETFQNAFLREKFNIAPCFNYKINMVAVENIEEIRIIPNISKASIGAEYVSRQAYYLGYGIKTNTNYIMKGVTIPNPKNQYATQIITEAIPTQNSADEFRVTKDIIEKLKIFQTDENIKDKFNEIHDDLTYNVTNIYGRNDMLTAMDLCYHSVLNFNFQDHYITKGWVEALIIGDTRSGKTEMATKICKHYHLGELCSAENMSYAGLVGGMQQHQKRWSISWGKIPLNDKRLLILDEVTSLDKDNIISNLSGIRSSGIAELTKIQTERTSARTRLLWLANPRSGRKLDTYNYGVQAIKELIGRVEDIARFDFAVTAAANEVDIKLINSNMRQKIHHKYTNRLCHKLILWVWSRKAENIIFTKEAVNMILKNATILGNMYSPTIPLVEAAEQRIKLARLAASTACRVFSTTTGENVLILPCHVQFAINFLNESYTKSSMGYDLVSIAYRRSVNITDDKIKKLSKELVEFTDYAILRELFLEQYAFRKNGIVDQMGYDMEETKRLFKWMNRNKFIKSTPIGYVKQPIFTKFLKMFKEV